MRRARIFFKGEEAGILTQQDDGSFDFRYHDHWAQDRSKPSISLTLPKTKLTFHSGHLFPFFYHMLPEGRNRLVVCSAHRIDQDDDFGLLLITARNDTIGAVTVMRIDQVS